MRLPRLWHTHQPYLQIRHKHQADDGAIEVRQLIRCRTCGAILSDERIEEQKERGKEEPG